MGISTGVNTYPSTIPQPISPRTFAYGQQGTIEMKPMDIVAQSTLAPGWTPQPAQQKAPLDTSDPYAIGEYQLKQGLQQIENDFSIADTEIMRKPQYKLNELDEIYQAKLQVLQNKFSRQPMDVDVKEKYNTALEQLEFEHNIAVMRVQNKIQPDRDLLMQKKQQAMAELQRNAETKKIKLNTIQQLYDSGIITDPIVVKQQQLQEMGVDVPLSQLLPPDPQQRLRELSQFITYIKEKMDIGKQMMGEFGAQLLTPEEREMYETAKKEYSALQLRVNPELAPIINRPKLAEAGKDLIENKGGTIGTMLVKEKSLRSYGAAAKTPTTKQAPKYANNPNTGQRIVSYDGGKSWQIVQ